MTATNAPQHRWALAGLTVAVVAIGFDITILNVALPTIATDLTADTSALQWMVNAYVLLFAGLLLPFGALTDRYGRRRGLLLGLAVFAAASLAAAWADTATQIIAARAGLGVGAALIMPSTLASLTALFAGAERARAVSVLVAGMGVGIPLGPIIGGYLLEHFWWGTIFLINLPIVALGAITVALFLPESRDPNPPRLDPVGAVLSTAGLVTFVYAVIEAPEQGWTATTVIAALIAAAILLTGFTWWELHHQEPLIDLRLFRNRQFRWGSINATLASFALFGLLFVAPQHLQFVLELDALDTGLRLLPLIAGLVAGAGIATRLTTRTGHRTPILAGLTVTTAGLLTGTLTTTASSYGFIATWHTIVGFGIGATLAPAMDAVLAVMPPERSGAGIAITMTMRQTGGALGVALLGSLLSATYPDRIDTTGLPAPGADTATQSIAATLAVADRLGLPALADAANHAYVDAMIYVLIACAAVTTLGAVATMLFMPTRIGEHPTIDPIAPQS
ncbi:MFS transporter [Micromonospora sp. WMMC250]|uniref:MFS transporter n=1 Tax=Micromonospora sp. WMMC250 TaxID=3014781 RepID=UPI0022B6524C|nr:MFS transporter [Micromonospora sp. WMMC250]MCZ7379857.1 MFS transporter [Micromonospora sp. WMMC250]